LFQNKLLIFSSSFLILIEETVISPNPLPYTRYLIIAVIIIEIKQKMVKENLETKAKKAILSINDKVADIRNVLRDVSMKLYHVIKYKIDYRIGTNEY
jgi:hypothetical protein